MVYEPTEEIEGEITPVEESIASPPGGETEKLPPAIVKEGVKETDLDQHLYSYYNSGMKVSENLTQ